MSDYMSDSDDPDKPTQDLCEPEEEEDDESSSDTDTATTQNCFYITCILLCIMYLVVGSACELVALDRVTLRELQALEAISDNQLVANAGTRELQQHELNARQREWWSPEQVQLARNNAMEILREHRGALDPAGTIQYGLRAHAMLYPTVVYTAVDACATSYYEGEMDVDQDELEQRELLYLTFDDEVGGIIAEIEYATETLPSVVRLGDNGLMGVPVCDKLRSVVEWGGRARMLLTQVTENKGYGMDPACDTAFAEFNDFLVEVQSFITAWCPLKPLPQLPPMPAPLVDDHILRERLRKIDARVQHRMYLMDAVDNILFCMLFVCVVGVGVAIGYMSCVIVPPMCDMLVACMQRSVHSCCGGGRGGGDEEKYDGAKGGLSTPLLDVNMV